MTTVTTSGQVGKLGRTSAVALEHPQAESGREDSRVMAFLGSTTLHDVLILISVLMFLLLAIGVGVLALQATVFA